MISTCWPLKRKRTSMETEIMKDHESELPHSNLSFQRVQEYLGTSRLPPCSQRRLCFRAAATHKPAARGRLPAPQHQRWNKLQDGKWYVNNICVSNSNKMMYWVWWFEMESPVWTGVWTGVSAVDRCHGTEVTASFNLARLGLLGPVRMVRMVRCQKAPFLIGKSPLLTIEYHRKSPFIVVKSLLIMISSNFRNLPTWHRAPESRLFLNEAMLIPWASAESAVDQKAFVSGLLWLFTMACVEALYWRCSSQMEKRKPLLVGFANSKLRTCWANYMYILYAWFVILISHHWNCGHEHRLNKTSNS